MPLCAALLPRLGWCKLKLSADKTMLITKLCWSQQKPGHSTRFFIPPTGAVGSMQYVARGRFPKPPIRIWITISSPWAVLPLPTTKFFAIDIRSNEQTWTPSEVCAVIVTPIACFGTGFLVAQQCKHGDFFCWKKCAMILSHPKSPCIFFIFYLPNSLRNVPQLFFRKIANAAFVVPNLHERDSPRNIPNFDERNHDVLYRNCHPVWL